MKDQRESSGYPGFPEAVPETAKFGSVFRIQYKAACERMELGSERLHDKQIECICNEPHLAYFKSSPRGLSTPWTRLSETGMPSG